MDFVVLVYETTKNYPASEHYGLISQMRRAAVSIPSNIAEGVARSSSAEYVRFLNIAIASANELDTQVDLSQRLIFLSDHQATKLLDDLAEINRMLIALRNSIRKRITTK